MALSAQNQSTSYVNLYYSIVQRAATRYFKEYYNTGEYVALTAASPSFHLYFLCLSLFALSYFCCTTVARRRSFTLSLSIPLRLFAEPLPRVFPVYPPPLSLCRRV